VCPATAAIEARLGRPGSLYGTAHPWCDTDRQAFGRPTTRCASYRSHGTGVYWRFPRCESEQTQVREVGDLKVRMRLLPKLSATSATVRWGSHLEFIMNAEAPKEPKNSKNRILASLPNKELRRLQATLEPVSLNFGQVLYEPGKAIRHVYFPINCLISLLTAVDRRRSLEVGMVGNEGMAGMPFILGMGVSGVRAIVQGGGDALRMAAAPFRVEFERNPALQESLYRYMYALMTQISQTAACNRFHEAEPRLARWLLMTRDRVMADEFPLTHVTLFPISGQFRTGLS
jgi:CRP-like cAMP-binding protein